NARSRNPLGRMVGVDQRDIVAMAHRLQHPKQIGGEYRVNILQHGSSSSRRGSARVGGSPRNPCCKTTPALRRRRCAPPSYGAGAALDSSSASSCSTGSFFRFESMLLQYVVT